MGRPRKLTEDEKAACERLRDGIALVGWTSGELARRADLDPGAVSRFVLARRAVTRLAAIQIDRAFYDALQHKEIAKEHLLTREDLGHPVESDSHIATGTHGGR